MKLYYTPLAPNPERVMMFLREKGIDPTANGIALESVSIMEGQNRTEAFREVSPLGQIPALDLGDGRVLTESRAICRYLEGRFPETNLMGVDHEEAAFIEMWDRRVEFLWMLPAAMWIRNSHPAFAIIDQQIPDYAEQSRKRFEKMSRWFNDHLSRHTFIAGDRFTIADITAFATIGFVRLMKWSPDEEALPHLRDWRDRMKVRPCGVRTK